MVRAIDRAAYESGLSRSAMINRIMAEYISMPTPEQTIREVFASAASAAARDSSMRLQSPPSDSMLSLRGAIRTKYNPTIRYCVELTPCEGGYTGELRVLSRSQSDALLARLSDFFELWSRMERSASRDPAVEITDGRYRRRLDMESHGDQPESAALGEAIGEYLRAFDRSMDLFFQDTGPTDRLLEQIRALYDEYAGDRDLLL